MPPHPMFNHLKFTDPAKKENTFRFFFRTHYVGLPVSYPGCPTHTNRSTPLHLGWGRLSEIPLKDTEVLEEGGNITFYTQKDI